MPKKKGITNLNGKNKTDSTSCSKPTSNDVKPVNIREIVITLIINDLITRSIGMTPLIIEFLSQSFILIKEISS